MRRIDSHSDRRWYLVSYDIRDPKRWRLAYNQLKGCGERIQYSLFRCRLSRTEMERLRWELEKVLKREDDLLFIHLCPGCAGRVQGHGAQGSWTEPSSPFEIL
jgi:CRISPR-associated protein Cas2